MGSKFKIYSSKATPSGADEAKTLEAGTNLDNFLTLLPDQVLVFPSAPSSANQDVELDESDALSTWIKFLDPKGTFSATFDDEKNRNITAFTFQFAKPGWELVFSSSAFALIHSFGPAAGSFGSVVGGDPSARVPPPGLNEDGQLLYFGLDISKSKDVTTTVQGLFDFAGIDDYISPVIAAWRVSLISTATKDKHNALWYSPVNYDQSTIRLQFSLDSDGKKIFQDYIAGTLPSFEFQGVDFICHKVLKSATSAGTKTSVSSGEVSIQAGCVISPKGRKLEIKTGISFFARQYDLTFHLDEQVKGNDPLGDVLAWLAECAGGSNDFSSVLDLITQQDSKLFGGHFALRQIKISLAALEEGKGTKMKSFSIDIEANATFGTTGPDPAVFLLNYSWRRGGPKLGTIRGDLWNEFDNSPKRDLAPAYEEINTLVPNTSPVAKFISIAKMLPGVQIENVPKNIPTEIARAYIMINQNSIALGGTVKSINYSSSDAYPVPQLDLGTIDLDASYDWSKSELAVKAAVIVELKPAEHAKHQETATLTGNVEYDSKTTKWTLSANLEGLHLSSLYKFFFAGEGDHVVPLIDAIEVKTLALKYMYEKPPKKESGEKSTKEEGGEKSPKEESGEETTEEESSEDVVGSSFVFEGTIHVSDLELQLDFNYANKAWDFSASLHAGEKTSIGKVIKALVGEDIDVPEFLYNTKLDPAKKDGFDIQMKKSKAAKKEGGASGAFQLMAKLIVHPSEDLGIELTFAQWHGEDWPAAEPSKRLVKAALTGIPEVAVPLVGDITQPFDEMYFMYVMDGTKQNKGKAPGITRKEKEDLNEDDIFKAYPLVAKDKSKEKDDGDVIISAGAHFALVIKESNGSRTCILDYDFKKQAPQGDKKKTQKSIEASSYTAEDKDETGEDKPDSDGNSSSAPLKKKMGPLSISNIGLKYVDKILHISFSATMELGPMALTLIDFGLNMEITSLDLRHVSMRPPSLEGFSVAFVKEPLTIAGIIRHGADPGLDYFAGGLIVGWTPYQLEAAGFYGKATPHNGTTSFVSVFVFARLDGPLVTLEFAEISGLTGGFGYHSSVRTPAPDQITEFPFIDQDQLGSATDAMEALQTLTDPKQSGWFQPDTDTYWAAAGMKIDAFQMIALDAVVVVQFGNSIKLGIFGVALVDIPSSSAKVKFAHVELGMATVVDFDLGVLKVEAQLSPRSFILHPDCKLTGGFALYYWFDAPHADRENVGSFVFTLGGYHPAFRVPSGWPAPERLAIAWSLGSNLSIKGEAFFAITPKVCMGGGRLRASYSAGPIEAWFDAFANFLIQYQPFHFNAEISITVGVSFSLDIGIIHIHISPEIGADLSLWGPPLAGKVYIDLWVHKFTIHFGESSPSTGPLTLDQFFDLVVQASSKQAAGRVASTSEAEEQVDLLTEAAATGSFNRKADNEGHTFLAQSGLMNDSSDPNRKQNDRWIVRGGTFSFVLGCKMVMDDAKLINDKTKAELKTVKSGAGQIFAKPMRLTENLESHLTVGIAQVQDTQIWGMSPEYKSVPTGLWQEYHSSQDPGGGNNNIDALLDDKDGGMYLMTGVRFTAPPPKMSEDKLQVFDIMDSMLMNIKAERGFPVANKCLDDWDPLPPKNEQGDDPWTVIQKKWKTPTWNTDKEASGSNKGKEEKGERDVQKSFVQSWVDAFNWDKALNLPLMAKMPKLLEKRFGDIYMAAPMMTR